MLFSVVIPAYNRLAYLQSALDSVWAQTFTDYEVIVVDDGSTDGTWAYLESLGPRVCPLRQNNLGPGAARNLGMSKARGDYLAFLDSDDRWFPWTLRTYKDTIEIHGGPSFLTGALHSFRDESALASIKEESLQCRTYRDYFASAYDDVWIGGVSVAMKHSVADAAGGFETAHMNAEDCDLWLKGGEAPGFIRIMAPPMVAYRRHDGTAVADLGKTIKGMEHLIRSEKRGAYPGGARRARERREILGRHVRPPALACLRAGDYGAAWRLYEGSFLWHVRQGRWKFLIGYFLYLAYAFWRPIGMNGAHK